MGKGWFLSNTWWIGGWVSVCEKRVVPVWYVVDRWVGVRVREKRGLGFTGFLFIKTVLFYILTIHNGMVFCSLYHNKSSAIQ